MVDQGHSSRPHAACRLHRSRQRISQRGLAFGMTTVQKMKSLMPKYSSSSVLSINKVLRELRRQRKPIQYLNLFMILLMLTKQLKFVF